MKNIKNWESFNEGITFLTVFGILVSLLSIFKFYLVLTSHRRMSSSRNQDLEQKIKDITGEDVKVFNYKHATIPAFATISEVFIEEKVMTKLSDRELIGVLLHETSHIRNKDTIKSFVIKMFPVLTYTILSSWLLFFILPLASSILLLSPKNVRGEFKADAYAAKFGYGEDLASALIRLQETYKAPIQKAKAANPLIIKLAKLLKSHPPANERLERLFIKNPDEFISRIKEEVKDEL